MRRGRGLQHRVKQYIKACAMSGCRELCDEMQQKLPRELRDMVYLELPETSLIRFGDEDYTQGRGGRNDEPILSFIVWSPHISDYNYVGIASLMELGEA
jgi:hypothetical protein